MEFPHLGDQCSKSDCKRLDFLPLKCDACSGLYCSDHITYTSHTCKESYKRDNQVPVCPLCNKPIPLLPGEQADSKVGAHIDTDCQSDPARERRNIYINRCSHKGCKAKELIPVKCDKCQRNFCLKHRHELDHKCKGFEDSGRGISRAAAAALARFGPGSSKPAAATHSGSKPAAQSSFPARRAAPSSSATTSSIPPGLNEDEALALAMQLSLQESEATKAQASEQPTEDADEAMARAIHQSQLEERRRQQQQRQQQARQQTRPEESRCNVS